MGKPGRELSRKKRSDFHLSVWDKSVKEQTFQCVVIYKGTREVCGKLEKTLIKLWKKKDDGGLLCNFTDGGDGGNTWFGPGVETRREKIRKIMYEVWTRPEYKKKHSESMNTPETLQKMKESLNKWREERPDLVEKHRLSVQKKEKFSKEELNQKYGSDKKGSKWYFNLETHQTKMFQTEPNFPWVPGRKPPKEV